MNEPSWVGDESRSDTTPKYQQQKETKRQEQQDSRYNFEQHDSKENISEEQNSGYSVNSNLTVEQIKDQAQANNNNDSRIEGKQESSKKVHQHNEDESVISINSMMTTDIEKEYGAKHNMEEEKSEQVSMVSVNS